MTPPLYYPPRGRRRLTLYALGPKKGVGRFAALGVGTSSRRLPDRTCKVTVRCVLFVRVLCMRLCVYVYITLWFLRPAAGSRRSIRSRNFLDF